MTTYIELKTQGEALLAQAEQIRKEERAWAISEIRAKMAELGLTVEDLGSSRKPAAGRSKLPAKYRGPNGELWAGGPGRKPEWVKAALDAGQSLDQYLIEGATKEAA